MLSLTHHAIGDGAGACLQTEVEKCWVCKRQDTVSISPTAHSRFDLRVRLEGCSLG